MKDIEDFNLEHWWKACPIFNNGVLKAMIKNSMNLEAFCDHWYGMRVACFCNMHDGNNYLDGLGRSPLARGMLEGEEIGFGLGK